MSDGQRQRLAVARNFYRNGPSMVMDEPASAIDALAVVSRPASAALKPLRVQRRTFDHEPTRIGKARG